MDYSNIEMKYNDADIYLTELSECVKNIDEASKKFDINLDIINGVQFFEIGSTIETYKKFKELNKLPESFCKDVEDYIVLLRGLSNESYKNEMDSLS